jgi:outer membrane protein OmpA-like peptidoglycan-associated protein
VSQERAAAPETTTVASTPAPALDADDPEPPDAQTRAEAVVNAEFNANKTTRLVMNITTVISQTSSLTGFGTKLAAVAEGIDARLTRLGATVTEKEVVIRLPGAILFDFDSANLRPDAERALTDVAQVILSYPKRPVRVEGHTDSIASDAYNQTLSEKRAASVVDWLAAHGVERSLLTGSGLGETRPVAGNDSAQGRQLNRRVEVVITRK